MNIIDFEITGDEKYFRGRGYEIYHQKHRKMEWESEFFRFHTLGTEAYGASKRSR